MVHAGSGQRWNTAWLWSRLAVISISSQHHPLKFPQGLELQGHQLSMPPDLACYVGRGPAHNG
eukprot:scaffold264782_cov24-Tisochrysis_lutea.AAC.1